MAKRTIFIDTIQLYLIDLAVLDRVICIDADIVIRQAIRDTIGRCLEQDQQGLSEEMLMELLGLAGSKCLHAMSAVLLDRLRYLILTLSSRRAAAARVREHMHAREIHLRHEIESRLELFLRLTGETHDDIRRYCDAGYLRLHPLNEPGELCRIIVAIHALEHRIRTSLKRQMQMRAEAFVRPDQLKEVR